MRCGTISLHASEYCKPLQKLRIIRKVTVSSFAYPASHKKMPTHFWQTVFFMEGSVLQLIYTRDPFTLFSVWKLDPEGTVRYKRFFANLKTLHPIIFWYWLILIRHLSEWCTASQPLVFQFLQIDCGDFVVFFIFFPSPTFLWHRYLGNMTNMSW